MNAEFNPNNLVKNLPDAYQKHAQFICSNCGNTWRSTNRQCPKCGVESSTIDRDNTSNNFKILEIERVACQDLRTTLQSIDNILDLNNAKGNTLDLYGERVGQARGLANDDKYLLMIKSKILRNLSNGSYPSIANAICSTFDCEPSQVLIIDDTEPCTVRIVTLPLAVINSAGLTTSQTVAIIKSILPVGISLTSFLFEGTFEFSAEENEYDEEKGFANSESDQSIGGYLGVTGSDTTDELLPI